MTEDLWEVQRENLIKLVQEVLEIQEEHAKKFIEKYERYGSGGFELIASTIFAVHFLKQKGWEFEVAIYLEGDYPVYVKYEKESGRYKVTVEVGEAERDLSGVPRIKILNTNREVLDIVGRWQLPKYTIADVFGLDTAPSTGLSFDENRQGFYLYCHLIGTRKEYRWYLDNLELVELTL